jgi:hypothetical protein
VTHDMDVELGKLLDQYDENLRAVDERRRRIKTDEDAFRNGFADLRASVVRPAFEAAGAILKARGHDFSIAEDEFSGEPDGKCTEAAISIRIVPAGTDGSSRANARFPSLCVVSRRYSKTVSILASNAPPKTSAAADSRGDYQLAQIDTELVQGELLKLIAGMVAA